MEIIFLLLRPATLRRVLPSAVRRGIVGIRACMPWPPRGGLRWHRTVLPGGAEIQHLCREAYVREAIRDDQWRRMLHLTHFAKSVLPELAVRQVGGR
jgi:hypothetical protein